MTDDGERGGLDVECYNVEIIEDVSVCCAALVT